MNNNYLTISRNASTFQLLCEGGLAEDMSQRIMFSILPHLADSSQVALTNGVVDVKGLKAAVEGRTNIIKYGVVSVLNELENYRNFASKPGRGAKSPPYIAMSSRLSIGDTEGALDIAIKAFAEPNAWSDRFGGRAWEMIAKTLRQIVRLDSRLSEIRKGVYDANAQQQEVDVMRDLVVELNIFDGLAHNSDSIMHNMVELETADKVSDPRNRVKERKENYRRIKRLMDAKELDNPTEVFKQIRDTLTDSGDINKFKDWVTKMRRSPDFFKNDPKRAEKLFLIYLRKALISPRTEMNIIRDSLRTMIDNLESDCNESNYAEFLAKFDYAMGEAQIAYNEFAEFEETFFKQYPELDDQQSRLVVQQIIQKPDSKIISILSKLTDTLYTLTANQTLLESDGPLQETQKLKIIGTCKEAMSLLNHYSYMLDSI